MKGRDYLKEKIQNLTDSQVRDIFKKIKDFKDKAPEIENESNDPSNRWDLFDILEYQCLEKLLNTDSLVDDYDDAVGRLEFMDFRDYINYYESKAFGKWKYEICKGSYLEVPVLVNNNYQNKTKYIDYRSKLERNFLESLSDSNLNQKDKYIEIFNQEYSKLINNENNLDISL